MRVLLTTESYLPYLSGVTVAVDTLARGLGAAGHEVMVLAPRPEDGAPPGAVGTPGPAPRHAWLPSYELPRVVPRGYRMPLPLPGTAGLREAGRFRPEVVHAHSPFASGVLARRLAASSSVPLVFTHHTRFADYGHYAGPLATPVRRLLDAYLRRFWRRCDAIVAPSGDLAAEIRARLPAAPGRVHVLPTGIDVAGIAARAPIDPRREAGWSPDTVVVASLGRLAPEKSPGTLLEAFALASVASPRLRLLFIGGGPEEGTIRRRAAESGMRGRVHITGFLPRERALALLAGADLFCFASRTETQGLVLAEALSSGLPCVALAGPGVADSVRDGVDGIIVPAMPPASRGARLAGAITTLVGSPAQLRSLADAARAGAARFSVERFIARTEAIYRGLLGAA